MSVNEKLSRLLVLAFFSTVCSKTMSLHINTFEDMMKSSYCEQFSDTMLLYVKISNKLLLLSLIITIEQ